MSDLQPDSVPEKPKPGIEWTVSCPRHGTRAHLYLEGLQSNPPDLRHCSLRPGQFPPVCSHACLQDLMLSNEESGVEELDETIDD